MNPVRYRSGRWVVAVAVAAGALAAAWYLGRDSATGPGLTDAASPASAVQASVFAGQVYPDRMVLLQRPDDAASATAMPDVVNVVALAGSAADVGGGAVLARRKSEQGPLRPVVWAGMPQDPPLRCDPLPTDSTALAPAQAASQPRRYVVQGSWQEYFDPGMPDQCEPDEGLWLFETERDLPASFAVLALAGFEPLTPDYSVAGQPRPLSELERAEVQRDLDQWKSQFRQAYGKDFNPDDSPQGEISTLAQAQQLAIWRGANGRVVLRAASWDRVSVGQHLYRVLVVDQMNGDQVQHRWQFSRHLGGL